MVDAIVTGVVRAAVVLVLVETVEVVAVHLEVGRVDEVTLFAVVLVLHFACCAETPFLN